MEKPTKLSRKPPARPVKNTTPRDSLLKGTKAIELSEEEASKLVGGIIEKGITGNRSSSVTTPPPPPRLSTLPFPLARHRSHGPHWSPNVSQFRNGRDNDDENDEADNDPTDYYPIADFAKPVQKKEKKSLNLSKWREFVPSNVSNIPRTDQTIPVRTDEGKQNSNQESVEVADPKAVGNQSSHSNKKEMLRVGSDMSCGEVSSTVLTGNIYKDEFDDADMRMSELSSLDSRPLGMLGSNNVGARDGETSMESQIDAENRALIQTMSAKEIAEAQAEIRNRINPELLKVLKKRGLDKSGANTSNRLVSSNAESKEFVTKGEKESLVSNGNISTSGKDPSMKNTEKRQDGLIDENSVSKRGGLWDSWSERVEASRSIRFSLDGDVIEGSSLGQTYDADNVAERDFLRMEGDPGGAGYTIKEALALTRSTIPGQRSLALHLIASSLNKALHRICESKLDPSARVDHEKNSVDWEAIWAYALGPQADLVLSLRIALDDNHNSVVLASAKVIQCLLAYDMNEKFFNSSEMMAEKDLYTAPVFRTRPDVKHGFLGGGFWKYSAKPSSILSLDEEIANDMSEGERTIQDDNVVAGQDVAAGLVRMSILTRVRYILETNPSVTLEECTLSILIAIARSSPTCANAIWKCERLVQTIINRFTMKDTQEELQGSKVKSVVLLRVLAQSSISICIECVKKGYFQIITWQLYRVVPSIDEWVKCGRENCRLASELMVEQLRFWKVCIMYGQCISYFSAFYPALCLWMNPHSIDKLMVSNLFNEFSAVCTEVYRVLEMLARTLPDLYPPENTSHQVLGSYGGDVETWCWSDVGPMVNTALAWIEQLTESTLSKFFYQENGEKVKFVDHYSYGTSFMWILSAVTHMLHAVLAKATPAVVPDFKVGNRTGPMLLDLVAKIALQIIKRNVMDFSDQNKDEDITEIRQTSFFVEKLCHIRCDSNLEASLASVRCLQGLFRVTVSIDSLIKAIGNKGGHAVLSEILQDGLLKRSLTQWKTVIDEFMKLVTSEWRFVQNIEVFSRGGPAPGVGVGWGVSGGGFWSLTNLLAQQDAILVSEMLGIVYTSPAINLPVLAEETFMTHSVNAALASSLIAGPGNKAIVERTLDVLLQVPLLKFLDRCIFRFLRNRNGPVLFEWEYEEDELIHFSNVLSSHFKTRWLSIKAKKPKAKKGSEQIGKKAKMGGNSLDTIHEEVETSHVSVDDSNGKSLTVEWAHQRLPLPSHWLLSPIATINDAILSDNQQSKEECTEVAKAGLFFLLGIEALSSKLSEEDDSSVMSIPLVWKLHSMSVALLPGMGILEEERSRGMFEALQSLYGQHLDEKLDGQCLRFQSEIHESYPTFVETLVEQFAAISYGDLAYGRQIGIYLHRQTESSVRLAAWNSLSNAYALDQLPSINSCLSKAKGYLEPVEDSENILEAYVKSWCSGSLDRAAIRGSMTFTIAVHHLSSFIFDNRGSEKRVLRNKVVKTLLRDYSRKQQHEGMMMDLVRYNYCHTTQSGEQNATALLQIQWEYVDPRFKVLKEACEGNSQILIVVEKLRSSFSK